MQAIIINSGIGIRMKNLTEYIPKCIVPIRGNETILSRQLRILSNNNINKILMTTGYLADRLKDYVDKNFSGLDIKYVYNQKYNSTNYIYSLYLVKDINDEDIIFMHGDMVFEEGVFHKLLRSKKKNAVLVRRTKKLPKKDFKARIKQGKVQEISVDIFDEDCYPLLPIYKLSNEFYKFWLTEIDKNVSKGEVGVYAEKALNKILSRIKLKPVYFSHELCMEIDDSLDLEAAKNILQNEVLIRRPGNKNA